MHEEAALIALLVGTFFAAMMWLSCRGEEEIETTPEEMDDALEP